MNNL
jgi:hypothetical protein